MTEPTPTPQYDLGPKFDSHVPLDALRWDDLRFPAQGINPAGTAAPPDVDTATGLFLFDSILTEVIAGVAQMPHAWVEESEIRPHVHWHKTTSASGNVLWRLEYEIVNNGDVFTATYPNSIDVSSPVSGTPDNDTAGECLISSFGPVSMRGFDISCLIFWKVSRIGGDAADTYGADALFTEFDVHFIRGGLGSQHEFIKQDWSK